MKKSELFKLKYLGQIIDETGRRLDPAKPWNTIHIDFAGPIKEAYYLVVVVGFTKWPEVLNCRRQTTTVTINFMKFL